MCQDGTSSLFGTGGAVLSQKWVIKDVLGQVSGPYDTQDILLQIKKGVLTGSELIASYPEGKWITVSAEPQFFDYMLEVISGEKLDSSDTQKLDKVAGVEETVPLKSAVEENTVPLDKTEALSAGDDIDETLESSDLDGVEEVFFEQHASNQEETDEESSKVEEVAPEPIRQVKGRSPLFEEHQKESLAEVEELERKRLATQKLKPLLYIVGTIFCLLLVALFFIPEEETEVKTGYQYMLPRFGSKQVPTEKVNAALKKAQFLFISDNVKNHMRAQSLLNNILAAEPRNEDALKLLCFTYFRTWPFASQSSRDLYVVSEVSKRAYRSKGLGETGMVCRVIEMILRGQYKEAKNNVSTFINSELPGDELSYTARYFNAYLLYLKKDYRAAYFALQSSIKLQDSWIPSLLLNGVLSLRMDRSQEAYDSFAKVLKINPNHSEALYSLAAINYEIFSKSELALKFFNKAEQVSAGQDVDKVVQSKAYAVISRVYLKKGDRSRAKDFAQKAFDLDPGNIVAKNILVGFGGKSKNTASDKFIMAEAEGMFNEEEWAAAIALYEQAYKLNRKNAKAALRLSQCNWELSFVTDAIRWAEVSIATDPKLIEAYILLSKFLISQFKLDEAIRVLKKARRINPQNSEIYKNFAKLEHTRKNPESAIKFAKKAIQLYPNDLESTLLLVEILDEIGETERALGYASQALEIDSNSFEAQRVYAKLLLLTSGIEAAKEYLEGLMSNFGGKLEYNLILAEIYLIDERFKDAAVVAVDINEKLNESNKYGLLIQARALNKLNKPDDALAYFQKAFLLDSTDVGPLFEAGVLLTKSGKNEQAISQFQRVKGINSNYPDLRYQWAIALKQLAKNKESVSMSKEEIALNPYNFRAYILNAENYYMLGKVAASKIKSVGTSSDSYSNIYSEMVSWYKLCASQYQKAIEIAEQSSDTYINMAKCYRLAGQIDLAKASAEKASQLDRGNAKVWMEVALIFEQQGNIQAALKAYENYLLILPNAPDRSQVELKINKLKSMNE